MPVRSALEQIVADADQAGMHMEVRERTDHPVTIGVEHERYVEVEYVGEMSLINDPVVAFKLAIQGQKQGFSSHQASVIRTASRIRRSRPENKIREVLKRHGFSQDYRWGKKNKWIQRMTLADAEKLKSDKGGHEFVILGHEPTPSSIVLPQDEIRISNDKELKRITGFINDNRPRDRHA